MRRVRLVTALTSLVLMSASCGSSDPAQPTTPSVIVINITGPASSINIGQSLQLQAEVKGLRTDQRFLWRSNDPSVARVSSEGVVTGLSRGTALIVAKVASDTAAMGGFSLKVE